MLQTNKLNTSLFTESKRFVVKIMLFYLGLRHANGSFYFVREFFYSFINHSFNLKSDLFRILNKTSELLFLY